MPTKNNYCSPHRGLKIFRIIGVTIGGLVLAGVLALGFGYLVKILWNWIMPSIFSLRAITYWEGFGLVILAKILFGRFGPHHSDQHSEHIHRRVEDRWHKWLGVDGHSHKWAPQGDYKNWQQYEQYWEEEGKEAFEAYLDKMEKKKEKK